MQSRDRWIALAIAVPGLAVCLFLLIRFIATIWRNELAWEGRPFYQEHYLAVGKAYSEAFTVGFFFCLFLVTAIMAVGTWFAAQRGKARSGSRPE